jgi:hypothetical protein|tara:strand:+ start:124 stop:411 length:288 start_codon:yes stop_codon:yes gene_type:complete
MLNILAIIRRHPQPIAFIALKFLGATFAKTFFSINRNGYKLNLENNDMSLSLFHKGNDKYRGFKILLDMPNEKFDTPDYYLFPKKDLASLGLNLY